MRSIHRLVVAVIAMVTALALLPASAIGAPHRASGPSDSTSDTAARKASYTVSAKQTKRSLVLGEAVRLKGTVKPSAPRATVQVQEKRGRGWVTVSRTKLTRQSTYSTGYRPRSVGTKAVRICKPATGSRGIGCSKALRVTVSRWRNLFDIESVDSSGIQNYDPITINGRTYKKSLGSISSAGTWFREYNLSRKCSRLRATFGIGDESESGANGQLEVLGDGNQIISRSYSLGQSEAVKLSVSNVLRIRIETTTDEDGIREYVGIGTPQVLCTS